MMPKVPKISIGQFHINEDTPTRRRVDNRELAHRIALALICNTKQDALQHTQEFDSTSDWLTACGSDIIEMPCPTQSHQRVILARYMLMWSLDYVDRCDLGWSDYLCVRDLYNRLWADSTAGIMTQSERDLYPLMWQWLQEFERHYAQKCDPTMLFELMKAKEYEPPSV